MFVKKDEFPAKEVPARHNGSGDELGNHIINETYVGEDLEQDIVQQKPYDTDESEHRKFSCLIR